MCIHVQISTSIMITLPSPMRHKKIVRSVINQHLVEVCRSLHCPKIGQRRCLRIAKRGRRRHKGRGARQVIAARALAAGQLADLQLAGSCRGCLRHCPPIASGARDPSLECCGRCALLSSQRSRVAYRVLRSHVPVQPCQHIRAPDAARHAARRPGGRPAHQALRTATASLRAAICDRRGDCTW